MYLGPMSQGLLNRVEFLSTKFDEDVDRILERYLGKNGMIVDLLRELGREAPSDRAAIGEAINTLKRRIEERLSPPSV